MGVFPYTHKEIEYLNLAVGYNKDGIAMIIEVTDIILNENKKNQN